MDIGCWLRSPNSNELISLIYINTWGLCVVFLTINLLPTLHQFRISSLPIQLHYYQISLEQIPMASTNVIGIFFLISNIFVLIYASIVLTRPSPLHKASSEAQVQEWLAYLYQQYPNTTHQLFSTATVMDGDSSHWNNWRATLECSDLHTGAIFTE